MSANLLERLNRLDGYLTQDPSNEPLLQEAFELAIYLGQNDRADNYLQALAAIIGDQTPQYLHQQAALMAVNGQLEEAITLRQRLCDRLPDVPALRAALATTLHRAGRYPEAEAQWQALESMGGVPPEMAAARLRTWHFLSMLDNGLKFGAEHMAALQAAPDAAGVLALMALDAEDFAVARQWLDMALAGDATTAEAQTVAGAFALMNKDASSAVSHFAAVLERNPAEGRAWSSLGAAELLRGRADAAAAAYAQAVRWMPTHIGSWHGLGWAAILAGDLPAAQQAFEQALALDRNFGESHGALSIVLALQGIHDLAEQHLELAKRLDRAALTPQLARAILNGELQQPEVFQARAERVLGAIKTPSGQSLLDWIKR